MIKRYFIWISVLPILFGLLILGRYQIINKDKERRLCEDIQVWVWVAARSYALSEGISFNTNIDILILEQFCNGPESHPSPHPHLLFCCPRDEKTYLSFSVNEGPRCPNGHRISAAKYKKVAADLLYSKPSPAINPPIYMPRIMPSSTQVTN